LLRFTALLDFFEVHATLAQSESWPESWPPDAGMASRLLARLVRAGVMLLWRIDLHLIGVKQCGLEGWGVDECGHTKSISFVRCKYTLLLAINAHG
jgi:hypothetical protein